MSATTFLSPMKWFLDMFNGDTDRQMTVEKSLTSAAFFYGVRKISNNFSMLPCSLYRKRGDTVTVQTQHASHKILKDSPNAYQVPIIWKQQHLNHALLWGNGRAYIHKENGVAKELIPLMPDRTITVMAEGEKYHVVKPVRDDRFDLLQDMQNNPSETVTLADSDVFHTLGFTLDGINGISIVRMAASTLGIDTSADTHSQKQLKRGYAGGLMLEAPPGAFRDESKAKEFLTSFRAAHDGEDNAGTTGMLREGIKANVLAMSNSDAQLLENRKFTRQQIALWLGLESILGDDNSVSYNSLEQKILAYLMNCLGAWLTQFEEQAKAKLLTPKERNNGYYFKFNDGALLRSDKAATAEFVSKLIASTVISRNEARGFFDLNPVDGGDEYENPAITPGKSSDQESSSEDPIPPATSQSKSGKLALEQTLKNLVKIEAKRVTEMAKKPGFMAKLDKFYGRWEADFANKLESFGLDRDLATIHCDESIQALTAIAEKNHADEVAAVVEKATSTWVNRVNQLLEGETCST